MLRVRFMPSDFHPLILILGDRSDLRRLAQVIDRFASTGEDFLLDTVAAPRGTHIRLTGSSRPYGLWAGDAVDECFDWRLDHELAATFRDRILDLCADENASGSETLECGVLGELPVKISHGEFTDDFLMPDSIIPA